MSRRAARELALKVLFQVDLGKADPEQALLLTGESEGLKGDTIAFAGELVRGTLAHLGEIDTKISELARDWSLDRMPTVDRNLLRMAIFELLHMAEVPANATINEAVELAKTYSTPESGRFVNGILGNLVRGQEARPLEGESVLPGP
ncbi:MAG: transcription antitermination factor NusB [Actinobacteria bacterium]|nr:transcription antitermination factor NusB [Actinomycetota bacterium]